MLKRMFFTALAADAVVAAVELARSNKSHVSHSNLSVKAYNQAKSLKTAENNIYRSDENSSEHQQSTSPSF